MKKFVLIFAIILLFSLNSFTATPDWIFKVPVKLKNLCSDILEVRVYCLVYPTSNFSMYNHGAGAIGGGWERVSLNNGSFNGVVTVKVNRNQGINPNLGVYYSCALFARRNGNSDMVSFYDIKQSNSDCVHKTGTNFIVDFKGTIK
ncbi:MAG: hypothetical protein ABFR75_03425 [Acidobacteriota bacterium]